MSETPAQANAREVLERMRAEHWNNGRWAKDTFDRYTQACVDAGVSFDRDLFQEIHAWIFELHLQIAYLELQNAETYAQALRELLAEMKSSNVWKASTVRGRIYRLLTQRKP